MNERLLRAIDNKVLRQVVVYSVELSDLANAVSLDPRIRWATEADRDALLGVGLPASSIDAGFAEHGRIAVLEDGGSVIARNCYWTHQFTGSGRLKYRFPDDTVMASDGFVDPRFRGRRYIAALKAFAAREFLASGYRSMVSESRLRNAASARAHRHAGARPLFRIVILNGPLNTRAIWANDGITLTCERRAKLIQIP